MCIANRTTNNPSSIGAKYVIGVIGLLDNLMYSVVLSSYFAPTELRDIRMTIVLYIFHPYGVKDFTNF